MSFFNRRSEMFDVRKRFGEASSARANTPLPENTSDKVLNSDEIDVSAPGNLNFLGCEEKEYLIKKLNLFFFCSDSWVELAPSRNSLCSSVEAVMFEDACIEATISKDSRLR